jgi:immune inhibitor A
VSRRIIGVLGGITSAALIATALQAPAAAAPPEDPHTQGQVKGKKDDRPDPLEKKRRAQKERAIELVLSGKRQVKGEKGSQTVKIDGDEYVQWDTQTTDRLLSFLVEFGGAKDRKGSSDPAASGPLHNQIPEPDAKDNSTYWVKDFNRPHYMDMFFNGMPEQNGESFADIYDEMSSGRYAVTGDVSDWVQVKKPESAYGTTESHADMTYFIDDTAEAWYKSELKSGKNPKKIKEYLQSFDKWDRYDYDGDGDFNEPDGYIDHFQAIHAGEGEEAGAPEWAIWSHRWAVNQNGFHKDGIGPDGYGKFGGIEIGKSGLWIRDYTTEPENGGLGVFAHEYAHDLGLPDLYDTNGGENGTGFWTLMSSGSWLGHGDGAIGTTPNHMGAWEKMFLGWLDFEKVEAGDEASYTVAPTVRDRKDTPEAVVVNLPKKSTSIELGDAAEGANYFYSGRGDDRTATVTSPEFDVPEAGQLTAQAKYAIEVDWDYAYAEISTDQGGTWTPLETNLSSTTDPNGNNNGFGITGTQEAWTPLTADLSPYVGKTAQIRFRMENDAAYNETGFMVDDIAVGDALVEGAEDGAPNWTMDKFVIAEDGVYKRSDDHYYLVENRRYQGYDATLQTGPYNFGWPNSAPNTVEHFPYSDGLLISYVDTGYGDNNTSLYPGHGAVLPIDARPGALTWSDGTVARNRIQSYDATFGTTSDAISLHRETEEGMTTLETTAGDPVMLFDDSDPMAYYDESNPRGSVMVGGTGTQIEVMNEADNGDIDIEVRRTAQQ